MAWLGSISYEVSRSFAFMQSCTWYTVYVAQIILDVPSVIADFTVLYVSQCSGLLHSSYELMFSMYEFVRW